MIAPDLYLDVVRLPSFLFEHSSVIFFFGFSFRTTTRFGKVRRILGVILLVIIKDQLAFVALTNRYSDMKSRPGFLLSLYHIFRVVPVPSLTKNLSYELG